MSGDGPPILVIDGEIRIEVPEDKTTYATVIMLSMMNSAKRSLVHRFVSDIYNLDHVTSNYLVITDVWFQGTDAEY
jgi:hypothetical protein